ncbi:MAG: hypothetical protein M3N08_03750 [Pseudomonadota bacterium]|nr:hypothetical protein [Pseudomonadota bacterium]
MLSTKIPIVVPAMTCIPRFQEVLLLCPEIPTGGPEALHQLALSINQQGGQAKLAYCGPHSRVDLNGDILRCNATNSPIAEYFAQYEPRILVETKLNARSLIIYPEVMIELAVETQAGGAQRAIWWLSVDNALARFPYLRDMDRRREVLADLQLLHLYQSEYARHFLASCGALCCSPLSDYTRPQFIDASADPAGAAGPRNRPNTICFFPAKGAALAKQFIEEGALRHPIDLIPLHNMTREKIRDTLSAAQIYIDFGGHPGKDRVPREAAAAGAIVLLHAAGAARHSEDHPLASYYLFTREEVKDGRLHRRIDEILDDPRRHFEAQKQYREKIFGEKARFNSEVRQFFFNER